LIKVDKSRRTLRYQPHKLLSTLINLFSNLFPNPKVGFVAEKVAVGAEF
jgi:hypothetical protein